MNISEFSDKPIPSHIVRIYIVNTYCLCDLYLIHEIDLKYKIFRSGVKLYYRCATKYYKHYIIYTNILFIYII